MRIGIIGGGVVGSATGQGLATWGHEVVFCDTSEAARERLENAGAVAMAPAEFRDVGTDATFISVSTPTVDGRIDLAYIRGAAYELGLRLRNQARGHVVVVRSTLPPGTTQKVIIPILIAQSGLKIGIDFHPAYNPEFLREVSAEADFLSPWLTVIGTSDENARRLLVSLYEGVVPQGSVVHVDIPTAEIIKYTSNLFNATKISFTNEIWQICRRLGIDGDLVMHTASRTAEGMWNPQYGIRGGFPYGGACLPKDTLAFFNFAKSMGMSMELLESVISVNERVAELQRYDHDGGSASELAAAASNGARPYAEQSNGHAANGNDRRNGAADRAHAGSPQI